MSLTEQVTSRALALGFDLVGIAPAGIAPHAREYADWIAAGMHGEMAYLARDPVRRSDVRRVLPDASSVIVVGLSHYTLDLPDEVKHDPSRGLIARYAWGLDYHDVMTPRLEELAQFVREESGHKASAHPERTLSEAMRESNASRAPSATAPPRGSGRNAASHTKVYADTGPVLERDWALAAGLGFFGKNTCLINPHMGSWLFLGVILTDASLSPDRIDTSHTRTDTAPIGCGRCTRCLTACPTHAFPRPYVLDARRCISYLTIELRGPIPIELRPLLGNHIFGCDICQEVCPWPARFATPAKERAFYPVDLERAAPRLIDLSQLSDEDFKRRFAGTPLLRARRRGLLRNVAVALGNWGSAEAREALKLLAHDPDALIAEHARWGLSR